MAGESEKGESGVIVEYFSNEMGFVKLDSEDGLVVLFHLNQVGLKTISPPSPSPPQMWEQKDNKMVMLKEVLDEPLQSLLPLGAPVVLTYRRLPAHNVSAFRWPACIYIALIEILSI